MRAHRLPDSEAPLRRWFNVVQHTSFANFGALRAAFPTADKVDD